MKTINYKEDRARERKNVLAALKAAGFKALVKHGRGTAHSWLDVTIVGALAEAGLSARIAAMAKEASGRSEWAGEKIAVYFDNGFLSPVVR